MWCLFQMVAYLKPRKIKHILKYASKQPIFWQFVGIGGRHYGVLEQLDTMDGSVKLIIVTFFEMDNIQSMPEAQLYDLLLQEFPLWLKDAKAKNIVKKIGDENGRFESCWQP